MLSEVEIWKALPGTKGAIEISNHGRIRSLLRNCRVLKAQADKKGYLRCRLTIERRKFSIKVHRAVAEVFVPNPNQLPHVNHKDGNKANNAVSNLEWMTNLENARHAMKNGLWENVLAASRMANEKRKKAIVATNILTGERLFFASVSEGERTIGTKHICACIKGERKQACGYRFSYAEGGDLPYEA